MKDKPSNQAVAYEYDGKKEKIINLKGDGDFRSEECLKYLKECDIVITNPPFSLFREFIAKLVEYNKKFLVIGNQNAITYKEIFKLIKDNKLWLGHHFHMTGMLLPNGTVLPPSNACPRMCTWFTNLPVSYRNEEMILWAEYNEKDYPKYDNYDAINVDKTIEIPKDYFQPMGVPITFLQKYNPNQFEIIGQTHSGDHSPKLDAIRTDNTHTQRLNKRHSTVCQTNYQETIYISPGQTALYVNKKKKYCRMLIQRRK